MQKVASPLCWLVFTGAFVSLLIASCGGNSSTPRTWGTAQSIDTFDTGDAFGPQVALNTAGDGLMVWQQQEGTSYSNWANSYTASTGWGAPERIDSGPAGNPWAAHVAIDRDGNGLALWSHETMVPRYEIWANRYTAGAGWGTAETLAIDMPYAYLPVPQPALDDNGNGLAVWRESLGGAYSNLLSGRYSAGTWNPSVLLEVNAAMAANAVPQIAMNPGGIGMVVWEEDTFSKFVWAQRYSSGSWSTKALVFSSSGAGSDKNSEVALDPAGNGLVVWQHLTGSHSDIWANRYDAVTGWGTAESIETDDAGDALNPRVVLDPAGNGLAVWQQSDGTRDNIWANRYDAVTGWGIAELIEADDAGAAIRPQIALDATGNGLAVWQQDDGTGNQNIWANRYAAGTGWGTAELIETDDTGTAITPQVALDAAGNGLAVWSQHDGTHWNIMVNRFR